MPGAAVHNHPHAFPDDGEILCRKRQQHALDRRICPQPGPCEKTGSYRARESRHLKRRHEQMPLPDRSVRKIARIPRQVVVAALVFGRRHYASGILREVEPRLRAEPHRARGGEKRVSADVATKVAEIRIAALLDRVPHVYRAVPPATRAVELHSAKLEDAGAVVCRLRRDAGPEPRKRGHRLESGSRGIRLEAGAVAVVVPRIPEEPVVYLGR